MSERIVQLAVKAHEDLVFTRQRARQLAGLLGFDAQDQTRIATAVSEIARNALRYAGGGSVEFEIEGQTPPQLFIIRVRDGGPGIRNLDAILSGDYQSQTGMGVGIVSTRRLVDQLDVQTIPGRGTTVVLKKLLPRKAALVDVGRRAQVAEALLHEPRKGPLEELQHQNSELLMALDELRKRQDALFRVNRELEDTNRGVVALYAELDEKADHLRRADEMKSRFLSNMSHEFRTPLHSILALTRLLLGRTDGELNAEQERQAAYVQKAAEGLLELVNDLLDIAKIEAGKIEVRPIEFDAKTLFSALRGMLRPLLMSERVQLEFEEPRDVPPLYTDESKVSQILRNFISNAIKFTERGSVTVRAELASSGEAVVFSVADTGIGIAHADLALIFEEFTQIEHPLQRRAKGTGLGLPLTQRLAKLLGGEVSVKSELGVGSTFFATVPLRYVEDSKLAPAIVTRADPSRLPVLVVEDQPELHLIYDRYLRGSRYGLVSAHSLREARSLVATAPPAAIVLDILLHGEDAWHWLLELKGDAKTRGIPVLVATTVEDQQKGLALGADAYCIKPLERDVLIGQLDRLVRAAQGSGVLIVDDEEASRYVLRRLIGPNAGPVHEAAGGIEGLRLAREVRPRSILLDLNMPDLSGEGVLEALRLDPITRGIPVTIVTSQPPAEALRRKLLDQGCIILSKQDLSADALAQSLNP